jgi:hypothetical protein
LILGKGHLRKVLTEFACQLQRTSPAPEPATGTSRQPRRVVDITARIERRQVLGGLISEYRRAA